MSKNIYRECHKVLSTTVVLSMLFGPIHVVAAPNSSKEKPASQNTVDTSFVDSNQISAWARDAVGKMKEQGIMVGDPTGRFRPLDKMTRQEVASTIANVLHLTKQNSSSSPFRDVSTTAWARDAIEAVKTAGIMKGDEKGDFHPDTPMTREELAVLLVNAIKADTKGKGDNLPFADKSKVSTWAKPAIQVALEQGLLQGDGENFNPAKFVQRQEVASVLSRLVDIVTSSPHHMVIDTIKEDTVTINGSVYQVSESLKGLLNEENAKVLQKANIDFESSNQTITKITYLELVAGGSPAKTGEKEFAGNLILNGNGAIVDGDLIVASDYITVSNLTVLNNFTIKKMLQNDFYAKKLTVKGMARIEGGDENTVEFEDSQLQSVNVTKQDVHVVSSGSTTVQSMDVRTNATIEVDPTAKLQQMTISEGAQTVNVQGTVQQVVVASSSPVTVAGNADIATVTVNGSGSVALNNSGSVGQLQVNNPQSQVTTGASSKVGGVTLATGVPSSAVSGVTTSSSASQSSSGGSSSGGSSGGNTAPKLIKNFVDPQLILLANGNYTIDLSQYLKDDEQPTLKFGAASQNNSVAKVSVTGNILTVMPQGKGTSKITVVADDQVGKKTTASFTLSVNDSIPDQSVQLGSSNPTLNLNSLFVNTTNDPLNYTAIIDNTDIATLSLSDSTLTLHPLRVGIATVTVTASNAGSSITQVFKLNVTALPNAEPSISTIPSQTIQVGGNAQQLDLSGYLHDEDNDPLTLTADTKDHSIATVTVSGNTLTLTPVGVGQTEVTLTVSDGRGGSATASIPVEVKAASVTNHNPTVDSIAKQTLQVGGNAQQLDLSNYLHDEDNDPLTLTADTNDHGIATVTVSGDTLTLTPVGVGQTEVALTVSDGRGGSATASIPVEVKAASVTNHNPAVDSIAKQTLQVGGNAQQLDLSSYLHDEDNDPLTLTADTNDHGIATVTVSGDTLTLTPVGVGQTEVTLMVSDGRGGTATASILVEVKAAPTGQNQAPEVVSSIYEQVLTAGVTNARTFDLTQLFEDPDGDALTFTAVPQTSGIVAASVSGNLLTLTPDSTAGSTKVQITADDGKGGTTTYDLAVRNAPLAPNGQVEIRTKQGVKDSISYDLSSIFPDQTKFQIYEGTPDSTLIGPVALNGKLWTWNGDASRSVWVIGANGSAVVLHVTVNPQGAEDLYFSQYMDLGNGRTAIQLFYNPVGDTSQKVSGYELEVHQYKLKTGQESSYTKALFPLWKGMPYLFIDRIFYDLFDIAPAVTYFNDELAMYDLGNDVVTTGFVLKKNGVVIDVLGDPTSHSQFMPNGGTIIRKSGIHAGSGSFNLYGEWNIFPSTPQYLGGHTP
ncbi:S-layer homology domain-containing protein [Aneurinibacillus uraniidurans]|uniref:S-layer homology domain-containing protein n=1 Tax=Aneurinibacillus uraniidurans TaxID=2966586 RepID=UPI002349C1B3|nr:S-layer homology domain-containing protein [Aneurinibacillus sp. B1]WCN37308.1 S-layer homology domain-containing protein [Aneurinibacillus sp. B1]